MLPRLQRLERRENPAGSVMVLSSAGSPATSVVSGLAPEAVSSGAALITPDGRYSLFGSSQSGLVAGVESDGVATQLYRYDRVLDQTILISRAAANANQPVVGIVGGGRISADGRFVTFITAATNVVDGYQSPTSVNPSQLYLFDCDTGSTVLITRSVADPLMGSQSTPTVPAISADGARVSFLSVASDLVAGYTSGVSGGSPVANLYVYNRHTNSVILASHQASNARKGADSAILSVRLAEDGNSVVFQTRAVTLVPGFTGGGGDVFHYDVTTNVVTLITRALGSTGNVGVSGVGLSAISGDARYVFVNTPLTIMTGFVDGNGPSVRDVYRIDRQSGVIELISHEAGVLQKGGNGESGISRVSADGQVVAFTSRATNLVAGMTPGTADTVYSYVYDFGTNSCSLVSHLPGQPLQPTSNQPGNPVLSGNGRYVYFRSIAEDIMRC